jgi:ATP-dependent Lhr-like helicase
VFLTDHISELWQPRRIPVPKNGRSEADIETVGDRKNGDSQESGQTHGDVLSDWSMRILEFLKKNGACFFAPIHQAVGGGYPGTTVDALWDLVWRGLITNDSFGTVRAFTEEGSGSTDSAKDRATGRPRGFRSRRLISPSSQGRWCLIDSRIGSPVSSTQMVTSLAQQLLTRYGVLTREAVASENIPGGYSSIYPVLKMLEESGRIRRGYFVGGISATQFASPAALDLLRSLRAESESAEVVRLAATDPANPYGSLLRWPSAEATNLSRSVGSSVILVDGGLGAYLRRGNPQIFVFLPDDEPARSRVARGVSTGLREIATKGRDAGIGAEISRAERKRGLLISEINGVPAPTHPLAPFLEEVGFTLGALGYHVPRAMLAR